MSVLLSCPHCGRADQACGETLGTAARCLARDLRRRLDAPVRLAVARYVGHYAFGFFFGRAFALRGDGPWSVGVALGAYSVEVTIG